MSLTYRFINSFQYEFGTGPLVVRKFAPYATYATSGFSYAAAGGYGSSFLGRSYAMNLITGTTTEELYPVEIPASDHVLVRFDTKHTVSLGFFSGRCTTIRFQSGASTLVSILLDPTFTGPGLTGVAKIEAWAGGAGDNAQTGGTLLGATAGSPLSSSTPTSFEVRVDFHASNGRVRVWLNHTLELDLTGLAISGSPDAVAMRTQNNGVILNFEMDSLVVATDSAASDLTIGPCEVAPVALASIATQNAGWTSNSGTHLSRLIETSSPTPDDDTSYISAAAATGDELFKFTRPSCYGKVLALALNPCLKLISGSPQLQLRVQLPGSSIEDFGSAITPESSRYSTQQRIMNLRPDAGVWTDGDIGESRFGFRQSGAGAQRVTLFYAEKLVSLAGEDYTCPASAFPQSYIH